MSLIYFCILYTNRDDIRDISLSKFEIPSEYSVDNVETLDEKFNKAIGMLHTYEIKIPSECNMTGFIENFTHGMVFPIEYSSDDDEQLNAAAEYIISKFERNIVCEHDKFRFFIITQNENVNLKVHTTKDCNGLDFGEPELFFHALDDDADDDDDEDETVVNNGSYLDGDDELETLTILQYDDALNNGSINSTDYIKLPVTKNNHTEFVYVKKAFC